jgi:hypothetical protein
VPGTTALVELPDATSEQWIAIDVVGRRSYCALLAPAPTAVEPAASTLALFRSDGVSPIGPSVANRSCIVAPATETALLRVTQSDDEVRTYRLALSETTVWSAWFFVGGDYSSFTMLRNTTNEPLTAVLTWRNNSGAISGTETVTVAASGGYARNARDVVTADFSGSLEVAHAGAADDLIASQTTLSATTGVSFDSLFARRRRW